MNEFNKKIASTFEKCCNVRISFHACHQREYMFPASSIINFLRGTVYEFIIFSYSLLFQALPITEFNGFSTAGGGVGKFDKRCTTAAVFQRLLGHVGPVGPGDRGNPLATQVGGNGNTTCYPPPLPCVFNLPRISPIFHSSPSIKDLVVKRYAIHCTKLKKKLFANSLMN